MTTEHTISATDFKARCLDLLDQLATRKLQRLEVTKRGRVVAVLYPPETGADAPPLHGYLRGSVTVPPGFDLTVPALDEPLNAETGQIHE